MDTAANKLQEIDQSLQIGKVSNVVPGTKHHGLLFTSATLTAPENVEVTKTKIK